MTNFLNRSKGVIENGGDYGRKDRERVKNMFYCKAGQGPVWKYSFRYDGKQGDWKKA